jgi:hypothetical protein
MIIRVYIKYFFIFKWILFGLINEQLIINNDSDNVSQKCLISIDNNSFYIKFRFKGGSTGFIKYFLFQKVNDVFNYI